MSKINKIVPRFILNADSNLTIEVDILTDAGCFRSALTSLKKMDRNSVYNCTDVIRSQLSPILVGADLKDEAFIQKTLARFTNDVTYTVHQSLYQAYAFYNLKPLYQYIGTLMNRKPKIPSLVIPVITGNNFSIKEYGLVAKSGVSVVEQLRIVQFLKAELIEYTKRYSNTKVKDTIILDLYDSLEPLNALKYLINTHKLEDKVGIYLNFRPEQYDAMGAGRYDFQLKDNNITNKYRDQLNADAFAALICNICQNYPVLAIENPLKFAHPELEQQLEQKFPHIAVMHIDGSEVGQLYRNCISVRIGSFPTYTDFLKFTPPTGNKLMYNLTNKTEDVNIVHVITGLGYDFMKMKMYGVENTAKLNELIRLQDNVKLQ